MAKPRDHRPRYQVLACDYAGTLATAGQISAPVQEALRDAVAAGVRTVLVTGRNLDDLTSTCGCLDTFHTVIAENGAVFYTPAREQITVLTAAPPAWLLTELTRALVPAQSGRVIFVIRSRYADRARVISTHHGLPLTIIHNKDAAMILPEEVDKGTGLVRLLDRYRIPRAHVAAVGDAENDLPMLSVAAFGVATANAVEKLKACADRVLADPNGTGVSRFIYDGLLARISQRDFG